MDARRKRFGLLHHNLCCLRSSWLVILSTYRRSKAMFTEAGGQSWGGESSVSEREVRDAWIWFLAVLVSYSAFLRKLNKFRTILRLRGRDKVREEEVRGWLGKPALSLSLFALLFDYLRISPSVSLVKGRRMDRCDQAAQATLVSSVEHHLSSWELSAWWPLQWNCHFTPMRLNVPRDGWWCTQVFSVHVYVCSIAVSPAFTVAH